MASTSALVRQFADFSPERMLEVLTRLSIPRYHPNEKMTRKAQAEMLGLPSPVLAALLRLLDSLTPLYMAGAMTSQDKSSGWIQGVRVRDCAKLGAAPFFFVAQHTVLNEQGEVEGKLTVGVSVGQPQPAHWPEKYKALAQSKGAAYLESTDQLVEHLAPAITAAMNERLAELRKGGSLHIMGWGRGPKTLRPSPSARNKYQPEVPAAQAEFEVVSFSGAIKGLLLDSVTDVQQFVEDLLAASGKVQPPGKAASKSGALSLMCALVKAPELYPELAPVAQWAWGKKGALLSDEVQGATAVLNAKGVEGFANVNLAQEIAALFDALANQKFEKSIALVLTER